MGLQLRFVIEDTRDAGQSPLRLLLISLLLLVVATALRTVWVYAEGWPRLLRHRLAAALRRRGWRPPKEGSADRPAPVRGPGRVIVAWAGMRGVVTLAAASGIPLTTTSGAGFPGRAAIQFIAFVLAVGTLLIQGATLPVLVRRLDLSGTHDEEVEKREFAHAQRVSRAASQEAVQEVLADPPENVDPKLLQAVADRLRQAEQARSSYAEEVDPIERDARRKDLNAAISRLRGRMLEAQRLALIKERDAGHLDEDVLREVLEQLDYEEAATSRQQSLRLG
jgi:CPA1 family monovalent cation:H+ antiporter